MKNCYNCLTTSDIWRSRLQLFRLRLNFDHTITPYISGFPLFVMFPFTSKTGLKFLFLELTTLAFCLMSYFNSVFNVLFLRLQKSEDDICLWCHMLTNFIRQISDFNLINWREETEKGETTGTLDYLFWSLKFLELQANHQQQHGRSERWEWDESAEHNSAHNNSCSIISNYYRSLVDPISEGGGQHKQSKKKLKTAVETLI
jgi:hypothetical protein